MKLVRRTGLIVCWTLVGFWLLVIVLRYSWHDGTWGLLLLNMFTTYLFLPASLVVAIALFKRRWFLGGAAAAVLIWHLWWLVPPWFPPQESPVDGESLVLITANLLMVHPKPLPLTQELIEHDGDVLMLQEFSPIWQQMFEKAQLFEKYPYYNSVVREDSFGSIILSKRPLEESRVIKMAGLPQTTAEIQFKGKSVQLLNVHTLPPRLSEYISGHHQGLNQILQWVHQMKRKGQPFVVAGDFNSTRYSRFAKKMVSYADDAWEIAGFGFGHTSPNGVFPFPPIRLDHVYVSPNFTVSSAEVGVGAGSDHRPIVVRLQEKR